MSRWNKAEKLEAQVMGTCNRVLGAVHPDTLSSMKIFYLGKAPPRCGDPYTDGGMCTATNPDPRC